MRESGRTKAMLCELVIVALFLALSAMTLLRLFAASNVISRESAALTRANILAQDALERFTAGEDLPEREEYAFEGETYAVLSEIQTEVGETRRPRALHRHRVKRRGNASRDANRLLSPGKERAMKSSGRIGPGASTILMILVVLVMTMLGVLSLFSARNDMEMSERTTSAAAEYYAAQTDFSLWVQKTDQVLNNLRIAAGGDADAYAQLVFDSLARRWGRHFPTAPPWAKRASSAPISSFSP